MPSSSGKPCHVLLTPPDVNKAYQGGGLSFGYDTLKRIGASSGGVQSVISRAMPWEAMTYHPVKRAPSDDIIDGPSKKKATTPSEQVTCYRKVWLNEKLKEYLTKSFSLRESTIELYTTRAYSAIVEAIKDKDISEASYEDGLSVKEYFR